MAKVIIAGNAVVVNSGLKIDDIKTVAKYRPEALTLYEGEGKDRLPVFKVACGRGAGEIGKYGAAFSPETHNEDGTAVITMMIPTGISDVLGYVSDEIGVAILNLNKLEAAIPAVLEEIAAEKAEIAGAITVMQ